LIIADNRGTPLICSDAIAGNHNDAYNLVNTVDKMFDNIRLSGINTVGLFLNADAGFDTFDFRNYCNNHEIIDNIKFNKRNGCESQNVFDQLLYDCRFVIERTNAWIDAFKALIIRFETNVIHWKALHLLAFTVILLRQL